MGKVTDPELYARTLQLAADPAPDFHICIGDDFSVERVRTVSPESLAVPYLLQRPFLGLIGQTAPVFLMNGNHEQASLYNYSQTDARRDVAVGAQIARNRLYPTPSAGGFYSGDAAPWKDIGELKSYCAWNWGDALFVLLDNYWHCPALVDTGWSGEDGNPQKGGGGGGGGGGGPKGRGGKGGRREGRPRLVEPDDRRCPGPAGSSRRWNRAKQSTSLSSRTTCWGQGAAVSRRPTSANGAARTAGAAPPSLRRSDPAGSFPSTP